MAWSRSSTRSIIKGKPVPPEPDGLVADVDPTLGQEIFDVSKLQRVSHVHHHDQTDDLRRAVEISERIAHGLKLPRRDALRALCLTTPFARLADDDERRLAHIAQSHRAAARHGRSVPLPDEWRDLPQIQAKYAGYRNWPEFGPRMPDAVTAFDAVGRRGASAGAERKLKQRAGARHQVDLAVTLRSPSEKAASTASGGGGAGNPPGLAQAKNLLVHFQRLWA
jgi:hypothetical protein